MFQSITKATETKLAFSAIVDVTVDGSETEKADSMEVCNYEELDMPRSCTNLWTTEFLVL